MRYEIDYKGWASTEVSQIIRSVEKSLQAHAGRAGMSVDTDSPAAAPNTVLPPCSPGHTKDCSDGDHGLHGPDDGKGDVHSGHSPDRGNAGSGVSPAPATDFSVATVAIVALVIGIGIGFLLGKRYK